MLLAPGRAEGGFFHVLALSKLTLREIELFRLSFCYLKEQVRVDLADRRHDPSNSYQRALLDRKNELARKISESDHNLERIVPGFRSVRKSLLGKTEQDIQLEVRPSGTKADTELRNLALLEQEDREVTARIGHLARQSAPGIVLDGLHPDMMVKAARFSVGGVLANLDVYGRTSRAWLSFGGKARESHFGFLAAAFDDTAVVDGPRVQPSPSVVHVGRLGPGQLGSILADGGYPGQMLLSRCIQLDLSRGSEALEPPFREPGNSRR